MAQEIKKRLREAASAESTALAEQLDNITQGDIDRVIDQAIDEAVQVTHPEREHLEEIQTRADQMTTRRDRLALRIHGHEPRLWIFEKRLAEFDRDVETSKFFGQGLESTLKDVESWIERVEAELEPPGRHAERLPSLLESAGADTDSLQPPVDGWPDRIYRKLDSSESRLDEFESRVDSVDGWFAEFDEQLDDFESRVHNEDGLLRGLKQKTNEFVHRVHEPQKIVEESGYMTIERFVATVQRRHEKLFSTLTDLETRHDRFQDQLEALEAHLDTHSQERTEIAARLETTEETLGSIRSALEGVEDHLDGFATTPDVFDARLTAVEEETGELIQSIQAAQSTRKSQKSDISELEDRHRKLRSIARDHDRLSTFESRLDDVENQLKQIRIEFENLPTLDQTFSSSSGASAAEVGASQTSAYSVKPANIELDIKLLFELFGSGLATSGATGGLSQAGVVLLLCAALYDNMRSELDVGDAFIYWAGYTNRDPGWELSEAALRDHVANERKSADVDIDVPTDPEAIDLALARLESQGCIERVEQNGEPYVIFRERCSAEWEA